MALPELEHRVIAARRLAAVRHLHPREWMAIDLMRRRMFQLRAEGR
jgi:hypothetical protein